MSAELTEFESLRKRFEKHEASPEAGYSDAQEVSIQRQKQADEMLRNVVLPTLEGQITEASAAGFGLEVKPHFIFDEGAQVLVGLTTHVIRGNPHVTFASLSLHAEESALVVKAHSYCHVLLRDALPLETLDEHQTLTMFHRFLRTLGQA